MAQSMTRSANPRPRSKPGRPTRQQAAEITQRIVDAATVAFRKDGFEATSMEAIALAAGVPKTTVYKRFADKKILLRAVIEAEVEKWSITASRKNWMLTDDLAQRLKQHSSWLLIWATSSEVRTITRLARTAWSTTDKGQKRLDVVGFNNMVDLIAQDIVQFGPQAGIHARDPRSVALALMAILTGWIELRQTSHQVTENEATSFADSAIDLLFYGSSAW